MAQPFLDFAWRKCAVGYRIEAPEKLPAPLKTRPRFRESLRSADVLRSHRKMGRIVPINEKFIWTRPLDNSGTDSLAMCFAHVVKDAESMLRFMDAYGALTEDGQNQSVGESVSAIISQAKVMRSILANPDKGTHLALIKPHPFHFSFGWDSIAQAPRLQYSPKDLLAALWLQAGLKLVGGGTIKVCRYCGKLFEAGPGHRRIDSECCSDEHTRKYNNEKRPKKSGRRKPVLSRERES
jgi:hypothetical protein